MYSSKLFDISSTTRIRLVLIQFKCAPFKSLKRGCTVFTIRDGDKWTWISHIPNQTLLARVHRISISWIKFWQTNASYLDNGYLATAAAAVIRSDNLRRLQEMSGAVNLEFFHRRVLLAETENHRHPFNRHKNLIIHSTNYQSERKGIRTKNLLQNEIPSYHSQCTVCEA